MQHELAGAHASAGDSQTAVAIVEKTLADTDEVSGRAWESELHPQRALLLLASDPSDRDEAEAELTKAFAVARRQEARSFELRTAASLAELWRSQGRVGEAKRLLRPVHQWFDEGFDTADLKHGQEVLKTCV